MKWSPAKTAFAFLAVSSLTGCGKDEDKGTQDAKDRFAKDEAAASAEAPEQEAPAQPSASAAAPAPSATPAPSASAKTPAPAPSAQQPVITPEIAALEKEAFFVCTEHRTKTLHLMLDASQTPEVKAQSASSAGAIEENCLKNVNRVVAANAASLDSAQTALTAFFTCIDNRSSTLYLMLTSTQETETQLEYVKKGAGIEAACATSINRAVTGPKAPR